MYLARTNEREGSVEKRREIFMFLLYLLLEKNQIDSASENSILLATDVAARGLDFQSVQHIVHYQVPQTTEVL
jgi:superfamily II DNA/RNA helicase